MIVSVIVPCYNEAEMINLTYQRLQQSMVGLDYELIFVNDGSKDETGKILDSIGEKDPKVKILHFSRNFGHQAAVTAGLHHCMGDVAVLIDADLQDPPELIPDMLKIHQAEKANVVYAVRRHRAGETWFKRYTARVYYRLLNYLADINMPVDTGDFRLMDRQVIEAFKSLREKHKYVRGLVSWLGYKQVPIYYDRSARQAGETKYPFLKMLTFALFGLLYFSKKPLKVATTLGFVSVIVGLLLGVYVFFSIFLLPEKLVSGWSSIISVIIFFGGVQLLTIGILGEYIGNIFDEVKDRPEYIIEKKI